MAARLVEGAFFIVVVFLVAGVALVVADFLAAGFLVVVVVAFFAAGFLAVASRLMEVATFFFCAAVGLAWGGEVVMSECLKLCVTRSRSCSFFFFLLSLPW